MIDDPCDEWPMWLVPGVWEAAQARRVINPADYVQEWTAPTTVMSESGPEMILPKEYYWPTAFDKRPHGSHSPETRATCEHNWQRNPISRAGLYYCTKCGARKS